MGLNIGYLTCGRTTESDNCYTPYYAVVPLIKYIELFKQKNKLKDITIWTPCDLNWSAYVNAFKTAGYNVIQTSIENNQDFLNYEPKEKYDVIITNIPFSKKDLFLKRLYSLNKPFCILLPMNSLQGQGRYKYFKNGIQLLVFDKRIGFHTNGNMVHTAEGNHFASCYFCKDFLPKDLIIEELTKFEKPLIEEK